MYRNKIIDIISSIFYFLKSCIYVKLLKLLGLPLPKHPIFWLSVDIALIKVDGKNWAIMFIFRKNIT